MRLGDWTISVLDPIDDMLMLHSIQWEDGEGDETGWRVAYVYRWLEEARDYNAETLKIRKTREMMKMKDVDGDERE